MAFTAIGLTPPAVPVEPPPSSNPVALEGLPLYEVPLPAVAVAVGPAA